MSNSLDPDQAQHLVGPELGPNCLQRLSGDDIALNSGLYDGFLFYVIIYSPEV